MLRQANDHVAYELITGWSFSDAHQLGGNVQPGMWMTGNGLRLMERTRPGVLHADLRACHEYAAGLAAAARRALSRYCWSLGQRDQMAPPRNTPGLDRGARDKRVVTIPGCGHSLMTEAPDAVLDALRAFLMRRRPRARSYRRLALSPLQLTVYDDAARFHRRRGERSCAPPKPRTALSRCPPARMATAPNEDDAGSYFATVSERGGVVAAAFAGASGGVLITAAPGSAGALIADDIAGRGRNRNAWSGRCRRARFSRARGANARVERMCCAFICDISN